MIWERVKNSLQATITDGVFNLWIEPIEFVGMQGEELSLATPDRYFSAYVKQNFLADIEKALHENGVNPVTVTFCENKYPVSSKPSAPGTTVPRQMRLPSLPANNSRVKALHPRYTFDEFMVGDSNILAQSACRSMAAGNEVVGPCLYINSGTGLGKSHLTHAVAHQIFQDSPMTRLHYLTAKQFSAEMVRNIQTRKMDEFKSKYQDHCDILLVEDIHSLTGKKKTQEELNDILDILIKSGKRVILTANSAPRDLEGIDNEFRSRMTSGLVTSIKEPDINTRRRIVEKKAIQQKLRLGDQETEYISKHVRGDIRKIESVLIAIKARASLAGGHIDLEMVQSVVANVVDISSTLTAAMIAEMVSGQFKVSVKELQSRSRKSSVTMPRQIAMYLARKHTEESLSDIGKTFFRDHTTVLHAIKVISSKMVRDASVGAQLELLSNKVKGL
jgi:chromosomal replication initiator protein